MNVYTAALYIKEGIKVRRVSWEQDRWIGLENIQFIKLSLDDLLATDWEIITEDNHVV